MREITAPRLGRVVRYLGRKLFHFTPAAITIGFTRIYWVEPDATLMRHELEHVFQAQEMGRLRFWWAYLGELRRQGYRDNAFERAARKASGEEG